MDEFHPQQPPNGSKELWKSGGEMIADVYSDHSTYTEPPSWFPDVTVSLLWSQIDENVQREIINHRSTRHPNIVRFKEGQGSYIISKGVDEGGA
ncbi:hypothetical protein KY290_023361 [Solanum tuberosum]|uniref:Uncharacterized protein n=1 Tax=Solanum tuberosum TaxID=4113 RepID=A0ABQ7V814_SOLTU|nr:hypothetical protein KY290_023361 [Solanum tuberosum]